MLRVDPEDEFYEKKVISANSTRTVPATFTVGKVRLECNFGNDFVG